jgi:hypothetical protein
MITIRDLIEALQRMPPDMPAYRDDSKYPVFPMRGIVEECAERMHPYTNQLLPRGVRIR